MKLLVNNKELDLGQESIKIELNSNIFSDSFVTPNFTYPFSLPLTATNLLALGLVNNLDSVGGANEIEAEVYVSGMLLLQGTLIVMSVSDNSAKCNLQLLVATKRKELFKNKLADLSNDIYVSPVINQSAWFSFVGPDYGNSPFYGVEGDKFSFNLNLSDATTNYGPFWYHCKWDNTRGVYGLAYDLAEQLMRPRHPEIVTDSNFSSFQHVNGNIYVRNATYYEALQNGIINSEIDWDSSNNYYPIGDVTAWIAYQSYGGYSTFYKYSHPNAPTNLQAIPLPAEQYYDASIVVIDTSDGVPKWINMYSTFNATMPHGNYLIQRTDDINSSPDPIYRSKLGTFIVTNGIKEDLQILFPSGNIPFVFDRPYISFPFKSPNGIDTSNEDFVYPSFRGYINYNGRQDNYYNSIAPYVSFVLQKLLEKLNIQFAANSLFFNKTLTPLHEELYNLVLFSNFVNDQLNSNVVGVKDSIDISQFMPELTLEEFLQALKKYFFLSIQFNGDLSEVLITSVKDIVDDKPNAFNIDSLVLSISEINMPIEKGLKVNFVPDSTDLLNAELAKLNEVIKISGSVQLVSDLLTTNAKVGAIYLVTSGNWLYINTFSSSDDESWLFYAYNKMPYIIGDGVKPYSVEADYCFMYLGADEPLTADNAEIDNSENNRSWLVPYTKMPMYSLFTKQGSRNKLRFIFDRGNQSSSNGTTYRLASTDRYNYNGDVVGLMSLQLQGLNSVGEIYGKPYFDLVDNSKKVKFKLLCNFLDLPKIKFDSLLLFKGNYYVVSKISYNLPLKDLVEIEAYQV